MSNELAQIENNIKKLTASDFGEKYNIALELSNIEEIPIKSFEELQELMHAGKAIMRQYPLSTGSGTFTIISTNSERRAFNFISSLTFLLPIAGIILGFIFSWWFLLLFLAPIFTSRFGKRIYLHALFNRAANSEIAFCFLFCGNCITLELPGHGIIEKIAQQSH
jgi:hypothetical protein